MRLPGNTRRFPRQRRLSLGPPLGPPPSRRVFPRPPSLLTSSLGHYSPVWTISKKRAILPSPPGSRDEGKPPGESRRLCVAAGCAGIGSRPEMRVRSRTHRTPNRRKHRPKRPQRKLGQEGRPGRPERPGHPARPLPSRMERKEKPVERQDATHSLFLLFAGGDGGVQQGFFSITI